MPIWGQSPHYHIFLQITLWGQSPHYHIFLQIIGLYLQFPVTFHDAGCRA